jgi:hypothetical protein
VKRVVLVCLALAAVHALIGCTAVKETGDLLYKDTATDSLDGRYPGFDRFLNRVSQKCSGYPIGDGNLSTLINSSANVIDALSRLYEGKISAADFSAFLGGWYPGTDTSALESCIFAELPPQPRR